MSLARIPLTRLFSGRSSAQANPAEPRPQLNTSGRQAFPALGAARLDDQLASPCGHTGTEPVPTGALQAAWLKCTLHCSIPLLTQPGRSGLSALRAVSPGA